MVLSINCNEKLEGSVLGGPEFDKIEYIVDVIEAIVFNRPSAS